MGNEYYGAPTTPTSDYLAHYGIKGMKWGVRRARESGNAKAMGRAYRKAEKHLAKLEKRAASGKKYAKRAALMGAGAAGMGAIAATGTQGISNAIGGVYRHTSNAARGAGKALMNVRGNSQVAHKLRNAGVAINNLGESKAYAQAMGSAHKAVREWGAKNTIGNSLKAAGRNFSNNNPGVVAPVNKALMKSGHGQFVSQTDKLGKISNSGYARLGAAGIGAGLAAGAGYNAYRAATAKRNARKAAEFRAEMNKQFAGYNPNSGTKKRKRR